MAILMKAEVLGQTREGYQQVFDALASRYAAAPGFIVHMSHPMDGGWCVMDVWETRKDFERFFGEHVAPQLTATVRPKITFLELHDLHRAAGTTESAPPNV